MCAKQSSRQPLRRVRPLEETALYISIMFFSCTTVSKPCSDGGEPSRDKPFVGTKQCQQSKNSSGAYVNDGQYSEWHLNGQKAIEGAYKLGKKHGKWIEWDESGRVTSEKLFEEGVQVPLRDGEKQRR
ncbi:MAG: hypothetical protein AABZ06_09235 [Bdellovibrionota bacterium]